MNICRICESIDNLLCSLNDSVNIPIVKMLIDLADVSYSNDDQLPKFLCQKCQKNLQFAIEFKRQCEMTDRKLRRLSLNLLGTEPEETEDNKSTTSADEEFENDEIDNYNTKLFKVEYLEEELLNVSMNINKEDIFYLQEFTEVEDQTERTSSIQCGSEEVQKKNPAVYVDKKRCKICNMSFETISALIGHKKLHIDPNFTCFYCNKMCYSNRQLEIHVRKEHCSSEIRTFECFECKKEFKTRKIFNKHYDKFHSGNCYECHLCSKQCSTQGNLNRHFKIVHDGIKNYKCNICQKLYGQKSILDEHLATHSEDRPFRCEVCEFTTKTALLLRNHTRNKHSIDPKRSKTYSKDSSKLTTTCEYCGKQMRKIYYYSHIRTHTGVKPFKCKFCPKNFTTNVGLVNHTYIHTGEYPYNCNVCDRKFRQIGHLITHTLTHTGEKPHQCTICSQTFAVRGNLTAHIRLHTGETPYHCTECSQQFGELNALKKHKKKYHTK